MNYTARLTHLKSSKEYFAACPGHPAELWLSYFTDDPKIQQMVSEQGAAAFSVEVLETYSTPEECRKAQRILLHAVIDRSMCLNDFSDPEFHRRSQNTQAVRRRKARKSKPSKKALEARLINQKKAAAARRGAKDSPETIQKRAEAISKATTGKPKPHNRKAVCVYETIFDSWKEAQEKLGISHDCLRRMMKDGRAWPVAGNSPYKEAAEWVDGRTKEARALKAAEERGEAPSDRLEAWQKVR